jgi:hypothetical protein
MTFERPELGKLFGMTGYLLSMMFILTIIMIGTPAHLQ